MKTNYYLSKAISRVGIALLLTACIEKAQAQTPPNSMTMPTWVSSQSSALLRGAASANDTSATAWFEWGTNFTMSITSAPVVITNFNFNLVSNALTDLTPGITYSARLVVSNGAGISYGAEKWFTTGMRMIEWGNSNFNGTSLTNIPPGLTNVVASSAGDVNFIALRNDGTVAVWGWTYSSSLKTPPANATNVVAVCAGAQHNLALRSDGTVVPWGNNSYNMNVVPAPDTNIVAISCGVSQNVVVRSDGTVDSWGGVTTTNYPVPVAASNCVAVAGGGQHNLALRVDGTIIAWGNDNNGQIDIPDSATNIIAIAGGVSHSLALRADGTVIGWGDNSSGQTNVPPDATNIVAIAASGWSSCGLRKDGTLIYWGDDVVQTNSIPGLSVGAVTLGYVDTIVLGPDLPPSITQNSATIYPNASVQIQLAGTDPNGDAFTLNVTKLPTHGALFQVNNGARGPQILTVPTAPANTNGWIFYTATNSIGTDTFTVTVSNEQFTASADYTVNVILPGAPTFLVPQAISISNNQFQVQFTGTLFASYNVWSSTNLHDWVLLGPATYQEYNIYQFWDPDISAPQKFYQATAP